MNMQNWLAELPKSQKPLPILSFPAVELLGCTVYDFTHDPKLQAQGILEVAKKCPHAAAAVTMMDLSVEAEAFGATVKTEINEVPTIIGALVTTEEEAEALAVPPLSAGRASLYVEAAKLAKALVLDRPVLAGIIGPYSLAGRLMEVEEALVNCLTEPDMVHTLLRKVTDYLISYAKAFKEAGVDGIVMAEPLSGLLSPALEEEFSQPYVREIFEAVKDENFAVIYHNCGPNTPLMTASLLKNGASAYHFGDAVDMVDILSKMPSDVYVLGNVSPSGEFLGGTPESMSRAVHALKAKTANFPCYILSSGCDIPPSAKWDNIDAFFAASQN
ncbi:MAG: uroporphyrinogen decarboxylase family protein [Clostridia bacterium]|nr:uroporphyrinogen decarboxylase family protein [Clostridia bacterium]